MLGAVSGTEPEYDHVRFDGGSWGSSRQRLNVRDATLLTLGALRRFYTARTRSRSRSTDDFASEADPQTGLNQSSHLLADEASDDAQQLNRAVGLGHVVV